MSREWLMPSRGERALSGGVIITSCGGKAHGFNRGMKAVFVKIMSKQACICVHYMIYLIHENSV